MKRHALILLATVLSLTTLAAEAARGGKQGRGTNSLVEFDDLLTDGIQSDLLGEYEATVENGVLTLSAKRRALYLDFSNCAPGPCDGPFNGTLADEVSVFMWVDLANGSG
jgi:hypothetical protein